MRVNRQFVPTINDTILPPRVSPSTFGVVVGDDPLPDPEPSPGPTDPMPVSPPITLPPMPPSGPIGPGTS